MMGVGVVAAQVASLGQLDTTTNNGTGLILGQVVDGDSGKPVADATVALTAASGGRARGAGAANMGAAEMAFVGADASAMGRGAAVGMDIASLIAGRAGGNREIVD